MSTAIAIHQLAKVFNPGRNETRAVDGITLDINPGELFFLLGPSGCGKTTLLRMIAGFIDPSAGSIRFNNKDITHTPPNKRNTGMVFQSYALWPHMTVAANVAFGLNIRKVDAADRKRRVAEALDRVQMGDYAKRKPNQLSGGQQQRVALARALVIRPEVLLLDEPLSNLDAKLRNDLRMQIRHICKDAGLTTVYVTHDQKEALSMADRVALLRDGQIVQVGSPRQLYRNPNSRFVAEFLGETNLLQATVVSHETGHVVLDTPAGQITATANGDTLPDRVLCSIRPESIRLTEPGEPGSPRGKHQSTTYLGETAQHLIALPGEHTLRVAELNPLAATGASALLSAADELGTDIGLDIHPDDVVILPPQA